MTATRSDAPTARIGNYALYKTGPATFVLLTLTGEEVGTFPTARAATAHAIALITAAHKGRKGA